MCRVHAPLARTERRADYARWHDAIHPCRGGPLRQLRGSPHTKPLGTPAARCPAGRPSTHPAAAVALDRHATAGPVATEERKWYVI